LFFRSDQPVQIGVPEDPKIKEQNTQINVHPFFPSIACTERGGKSKK
jgi:hypothetical protein